MRRDTFERMVEHAREVNERSPQLGCIAVRTDAYHDAGANAVQELAIALSTGAVYLREMTTRGLAVNQVAGRIHFFLSIGENFFMEIAKLRAMRMMWSQVVRAFGGDVEMQKIQPSCPMRKPKQDPARSPQQHIARDQRSAGGRHRWRQQHNGAALRLATRRIGPVFTADRAKPAVDPARRIALDQAN